MTWVLLSLSGCVRVDDEERVTWNCAKTADGERWDCVQERMRGGVPLGPVTAGAAAAQPAATAAASPVSRAATAARVPDFRPPDPQPPSRAAWSERLPGLQEAQVGVEALPVASSALQSEPPGRPPPEPEPALARWTAERNSPSPQPDLPATSGRQPAAASANPESGSAAPATTASRPARARPATAGPYTVQVGAFRTVADARAYIDRHGLGALPLEVRAVDRGGRKYQVVTFGSFATVRAAKAAWREAVAGRELDFWVRPVR